MADLPLRLYQLQCLIDTAFPDLASHFADLGLATSM